MSASKTTALRPWRGPRGVRPLAAAALVLSAPASCGQPFPEEDAGPTDRVEIERVQGSSAISELYLTEPSFESAPMGFFSTGAALADLDGDHLPEMIVSNGNDMSPQPIVVHQNRLGRHDRSPDWYSGDFEYHGDLAVGDVDGDGWVDVAVSVAFDHGRRLEGGGAKIHFNRGGALEEMPSYRTADGYSSMSVALGDVDGDGDLDLAVAALSDGPGDFDFSAHPPGHVRIYRNDDGHVEPTPSWVSRESLVGGDVTFADVNQDGWMDLVVAAERTSIYHGHAPRGYEVPLPDAASWVSADVHPFSYSVDVGRIAPDQNVSVVVSSTCLDPYDEECQSSFVAYRPEERNEAVWRSDPVQFSSKLLLADLDTDGSLDLVAGEWGPLMTGGRLLFFGGSPHGLPQSPDLVSTTSAVREGIAVADVERLGLCLRHHGFVADAPRAVVTLPERRIVELTAIVRDGAALSPGAYAWVPDGDWVSLATPLLPGDRLEIDYVTSTNHDILVVNYQNYAPPVGNDLFTSFAYPHECSIPTDP